MLPIVQLSFDFLDVADERLEELLAEELEQETNDTAYGHLMIQQATEGYDDAA